MPAVEDRPTGAPCWIDVFTSDPDASRAFYGELFGWQAGEADEALGGYWMFHHQGHPVAGGMRNDGSSGQPDQWMVHLQVADAEATVEAARAHGGSVHVEPMEVAGTGTMSVVGDPGGAGVGAWQPGPFTGFDALAEPGLPAWFELHTRAYEESVKFYTDVFGWQCEVAGDQPEFRYTTLGSGPTQAAGIMDGSIFPDDAPMTWSVYVAVADLDASLAQARELGAQVLAGPDDTPFGRLASLSDPTGAPVKLIQLPQA